MKAVPEVISDCICYTFDFIVKNSEEKQAYLHCIKLLCNPYQ